MGNIFYTIVVKLAQKKRPKALVNLNIKGELFLHHLNPLCLKAKNRNQFLNLRSRQIYC